MWHNLNVMPTDQKVDQAAKTTVLKCSLVFRTISQAQSMIKPHQEIETLVVVVLVQVDKVLKESTKLRLLKDFISNLIR